MISATIHDDVVSTPSTSLLPVASVLIFHRLTIVSTSQHLQTLPSLLFHPLSRFDSPTPLPPPVPSTMPGDVPTGTYRAAIIEKAKGSFKVVDKPFRPLKPTEALIKVEACGVCHSDSFTVNGVYPIDFPRVPGHEVCGEVVAVGEQVPEVRGIKVGVRVGRGWHGGHCWGCPACMEGNLSAQRAQTPHHRSPRLSSPCFTLSLSLTCHCVLVGVPFVFSVLCKSNLVSGITDDGGYAEFMYAPWDSLAIVPQDMPAITVGPLMCAGVTVFNGLRECKVPPPAIVAVLGVGGLGHLAIQFAARCGYTVVAVARGADKESRAKELGATHYLDNTKGDAGKKLKEMGGAAVIVATATDSKSQSGLIEGLGRNGTLLVLGIDPKPIEAGSVALISSKAAVKGHASGTAWDSQQTLEFAQAQKVRVVTEEFSLDDAQKAYDRMMDGKAHFRCVIVPGKK